MNNIDELSVSSCLFSKTPGVKRTLAEQAQIILDAGINFMELADHDTPEEEIAALQRTDIKIWAVHGIMGFGSISPDRKEREAAVEAAYEHAARRSAFAPCPLVEHYLFRHNDPEIGKRFHESVAMLYEKVSKLGFILCIETVPYKPLQYERHPDSLEVAEFVRSFGKDDLQVIVDINHSNLSEDLVQTAVNTRGLVKSVHVSNNHGIKEEHLPPWEGVIDIKRAFMALRENGYTGPCNMEFRFPGGGVVPDAAMLVEVRQYMEKLLWNR